MSHIFARWNKLLIWFKIKISDNCFNFIGNRFLSSIFFSYVLDFVPRPNSNYSYWILPISICLIEKFHKVILCRTWGFVVTHRYLTLSVGYSILPHNFIFKSLSKFFCLDLKITISVFLTLKLSFIHKFFKYFFNIW